MQRLGYSRYVAQGGDVGAAVTDAMGREAPTGLIGIHLNHCLTGTGASAALSHWENGRAQALAAAQAPPPVTIPVGFTTFSDEIFAAPRSWAEAVYPTLSYFNETDRGDHVATWEEPELFASQLRAAFRPLR